MRKKPETFERKSENRDSDERARFVSWRDRQPQSTNYRENEVEITVGKDRHVHFSGGDGEHFIYLYPAQVKHLIKILRLTRILKK